MLIKQKCYLLNTDATVSFDAAQAYCFNQGGKLFEPTYNGIDEAVRAQIALSYWIGITDNANEGK